MMKTLFGAALAGAIAFSATANAQETINLTVASSHPTVVPWVGMIKTHFMAETDRILAESGNYEIEWQEAFGGQLYGANATLSSVQDGITDIGWVFSYLEAARMPLSQVTAYTPFSTSNPVLQLDTMRELYETFPAFRDEWEQYDIVLLGMTGSDNYDVYTKEPIFSLDDLQGLKLSAPGALGNWLRGIGANAVDGALTTFYTDIQTGVSDGVITLALGALAAKLHEVAPYISRVQIGTVYSGGVAINADVWETLPAEVQDAMLEAGDFYSKAHGQDLVDRQEMALHKMIELGADQDPPVTVSEIPASERQKWVDNLPDLAGEWAAQTDERGIPGSEFLSAYMNGLRERGEEPARAWDKAE
jgi:TRAP-type transport system periplasmic protein